MANRFTVNTNVRNVGIAILLEFGDIALAIPYSRPVLSSSSCFIISSDKECAS